MAQAQIEMAPADRQLLAFMQSIAKGFDKIAEAQTKVEVKSRESFNVSKEQIGEQESGLERMVGRLTKAGVAIAGLQKAWQLAAEGYRLYNEQNERSRQTTLTLAQLQLQAAQAFSPDATSGTIAEGDARLKAMSGRTGVPLGDIYAMADTARGNRGKMSTLQADQTIENVANYSPNMSREDKSNMITFVQGLMNTYGLTADQAIGVIKQGNETHATTDAGQYARFTGPTVKNLGNMGLSLQEAIALPSAISQSTQDYISGRESATGSELLVSQLKGHVAHYPGMRGAGLDKTLSFLQSDPQGQAVARRLLGSNHPDAAQYNLRGDGLLNAPAGMKATFASLISGKGEGWEQYKIARSQAVNPEQAAAYMSKLGAEIRALPEQKAALANITSDQKVEAIQLNAGRSYKAQGYDSFHKLLAETDVDILDRKSMEWKYAMTRGDHFDVGENIMKNAARDKRWAAQLPVTTTEGAERTTREANALERAAAALETIQQKLTATPSVSANGERPAMQASQMGPVSRARP